MPTTHKNAGEFTGLLIVGASARAAAKSAQSLNARIFALDMFADSDTRRIAATNQFDNWEQVPNIAKTIDTSHVMFTGGAESHVHVLNALSNDFDVLGTSGSQIARTKQLNSLNDFCERYQIRFPESRIQNFSTVFDSPNGFAPDDWLIKRMDSVGGIGVCGLNSQSEYKSAILLADSNAFLQRRVEGTGISALCIASHDDCRLVGISEQLVGRPEFHAPRYSYCGSVGPLVVDEDIRVEVIRIASAIAKEFEIRGVFGFDAIANTAGVWLIEINPRYPASAEVFEPGLSIANLPTIVEMHVEACRNNRLPPQSAFDRIALQGSKLGKAFMFSPFADAIFFDEKLADQLCRFEVADIPMTGTTIQSGHPILTLLTEGAGVEIAKEKLITDSKAFFELVRADLNLEGEV